jgi:hypothetical protein
MGGGVIATAAHYGFEGDPRVARLQEELACRDEIIVALQHVIRELRHELENLRVEHCYAVFACEPSVDEREQLTG